MDKVWTQPDQAVSSESVEDLADHGEAVATRLALLALPPAVWHGFRPGLAPAMASAASAVSPLIQMAQRAA
eukprot:12527071-Alexandrium_andersonii.AAC.1